MVTSGKCFTSKHMSQGKLHGEVGGSGGRDGPPKLASASDTPGRGPSPTVFPLEAATVHLQLSQLDVAQDVGVCRGGGQGIICVSWGSR